MFTDVGKSCPSRDLYATNTCLRLFAKIKSREKFPNLHLRKNCPDIAPVGTMVTYVSGNVKNC